MWKLVNERKPNLVHYLTVGKEFSIGRKDADIVIPDDMSISRKHAVVKIIHPEGNLAFPERKSVLHFKDISKLGTQLCDGRIANGQEKTLGNGDLLIFGTAGISRYRAICEPFVITTSCLVQTSKKDVKRNVIKLGGHLVNEWSADCQMVIMSNLSVTIKVISSLLSLKPIVTSQYLEDLLKAIECSAKLPKTEDYLPCLSESQVNSTDVSFSPDVRRQTLFMGKTFVFLSATQFQKLRQSLELGGAKTKLIVDGNEIETLVSAESVCVMMPDAVGSQEAALWLQNTRATLSKMKRRMILEAEIGFAVLYCSTATHCNPDAEIAVASGCLPPQSLSQNLVQSSYSSRSVIGQSQSPGKSVAISSNVDSSNTFRIPLPVPPSKIKEEPLSQPLAASQTTRSQKRSRDESDCKDDVNEGIVSSIALESIPPFKKVCTEPCRVQEMSKGDVAGLSELHTKNNEKNNLQVGLSQFCENSSHQTTSVDFDAMVCNKLSRSSEDTSLQRKQNRLQRVHLADSEHITGTLSIAKTEDLKIEIDVFNAPEAGDTGSRYFQEPRKENIEVLPGYLSAVAPIKVRVDPEFVKCEDLPNGLVVTEVRSLVVQQPGQKKSKTIYKSGAVVTWKGREVKNFKKFKKVHSLGTGGLPRIIGGKDLEVHESIATEQREEWFRNDLEAESQKRNSELESQDLFNWKAPLAKRR